MLFHRISGRDEIADLVARDDLEVLAALAGKPALLHLTGEVAAAPHRMVSVLLHGNEDSGFRGLLQWLRSDPTPHNPLWMFIGNTRAASQEGWFADRYLPDQEDFNRVWGIHPVSNRMRRCAAEVLDIVTATPLEAAVDVHNNTGDNPLYAIVPQASPEMLALAGTVADVGLLWGTQAHTLMQALEPFCPAVAVECGLAGVPAHAEDARAVIEKFVAASRFEEGTRPVRMYRVTDRVEVRPEVAFDFAAELDDDLDFAITPGLDQANFGHLPAGTVIGEILPGSDLPLVVRGLRGEDRSDTLLEVADGRVRTTRDLVPAMMTRTQVQTRRDCLFYVVEAR